MTDMFNSLKKNLNKRSITAYLVFGAIILVFVFFGFRTTEGPQLGYAARVNNKLISISEYRMALERITYFSRMFGGGSSPEMDTRNKIDALNQVIQLELISQGATKEGFKVTNAELVDKIMNDDTFKKDGIFQRSIYERALTYEGLSPAAYEDRVRRSLLYQKAYDLFQNSIVTSDLESSKTMFLNNEKMNLEFMKLEISELKSAGKDAANQESAFNQSVSEIEKLYTENPNAAIEKAQKLGLKWGETGLFNLASSSVPKIGGSTELVTDAYKMAKGVPAKKIYSVMTSKYIVRLKDKKSEITDSEKPETVARALAGPRTQEIFQLWSKELAQSNKIERNPSVVQLSAE